MVVEKQVERANRGEGPAEVSDAELVQEALSGNDHSFALLYRRHAPKLAQRLRALLGRESDVEDVLQMTFLEVHRVLGRYDLQRPFASWLRGVAHNMVRRRRRKKRWWLIFASHESEGPGSVAAPGPSPEELVSRQQLSDQLYQALDKLPHRMRLAFVQHEIEGLPLRQVAAEFGTSPQAVWKQVQRARQHVQRHFDKVNLALKPRKPSA